MRSPEGLIYGIGLNKPLVFSASRLLQGVQYILTSGLVVALHLSSILPAISLPTTSLLARQTRQRTSHKSTKIINHIRNKAMGSGIPGRRSLCGPHTASGDVVLASAVHSPARVLSLFQKPATAWSLTPPRFEIILPCRR